MIDLDTMREKLMSFYTKEACYNLYEVYLKNWIAEGYIGEDLTIFDLSLVDRKTAKEFYIDLLLEIYLDEKKFRKIYETLLEDVQKLFEEIIWKGYYQIKYKEEDHYLEKNTYFSNKLSKRFQFFREKSSSFLGRKIYLDYELCKLLRKYFEKKPESYYLNDSSSKMKAEKKLYKDNNEKEFLTNMSLYLDFSKSGAIKISSTGKIMKDSKKNMFKHCNITEYYGDLKDLEFLKTENLCMFFELLDRKYQNETYFNSTNIKDILCDFISTKNHNKDEHYPYTTLFLNYLKGIKNIWEHKEDLKAVSERIIKIIKEDKKSDIVIDVNNLFESFKYRNEDEYLIQPKDVEDYLYINEASSERRRIYGVNDYEDLVLLPFIKSYLFLLGTLGIFELYYTEPEAFLELYLKNNYLTAYDGLKYVKLTELGKYVLGFEDRYAAPINYEKSEIFLDDKRLILAMTGESPAKKMYFEKVAKKIGVNLYKITVDSFKKGVKNSEDLNERIRKFKKNTDNKELPKNWRDFFDDLTKKFNSIREEFEYSVWKIKEDRELLDIIKKDIRIKNLTLKAEGYFLLVNHKNKEKVIKIFEEYGYHINTYDILEDFVF